MSLREPRTGWFTPRWIVRGGVIVVLAAVVMTIVIHADDVRAGTATFVVTVVAFLLSITLMRRHQVGSTESEIEPSPLRKLRSHPELLCPHNSLTHSLCQLAGQNDEILRDCASVRLAAIREELRKLGDGKVVFTGTESWRTAYERILRSSGMGRYFSVAWLRSEDYWRDAPGRHSMQLNYDLIQLGFRIERTLILNDFFWPRRYSPFLSVCCLTARRG